MEVINDYVTNLIINDKKNTNWGNVITYIDFNGDIDNKCFCDYLTYIITNNKILSKTIVKGKVNYFKDTKIDIEKHYKIYYCDYNNFDKKTLNILNKNYKQNWYFSLFIDKKNHKFRMYFMINHSYADGHKIISMLTTCNKFKYKNPHFKRKSDYPIYYYTIGTIVLIFLYLKILLKYSLKKKENIKYDKETNFINKKYNLSLLKNNTSKNNITLNDLLYSISIKTHYYYFKENRNIFITSPFNTGNSNNTNNFFFICSEINNNLNKNLLFKKINLIFSYCKYSLCIPILMYVLNFINDCICHIMYNNISDNIDIIYANVIGPYKDDLHDANNNCVCFDSTINNINIENITFLMNHKKRELTFNIISYDDIINMTLTYQANLYNKKKLKKALDNAYDEIMN